jgi:hypothetical protein
VVRSYALLHHQPWQLLQSSEGSSICLCTTQQGSIHTRNKLVTRFTTAVTFLTPNNPLYQHVIRSVLAAKTKAFPSFGSKLTNAIGFSTPTKNKGASEVVGIDTSPSDVQAILLGLTSEAITESSTKTRRNTERKHANEAAENRTVYKILCATIQDKDNKDRTATKIFKKAIINPVFAQVLKANKNSKAIKLLQAAIEAIAAGMNFRENCFASASDHQAELFNHPLTAAICSTTWEFQHTV